MLHINTVLHSYTKGPLLPSGKRRQKLKRTYKKKTLAQFKLTKDSKKHKKGAVFKNAFI